MRTRLTLKPHSIATEDQTLKAGPATIAASEILLRKSGDSRELNASHVTVLAESIAALGVLEPIILDTTGRLLGGGHRLAALQLLMINEPGERAKTFSERLGLPEGKEPSDEAKALIERISTIKVDVFLEKYPKCKVPVLVIDTESAENLELAIETAENSIRRQYTTEEISVLAKRLLKAGYTHREGRPKTGEKAMMPALEAIVGKSTKQLARLLKSKKEKEKEDSEDPKKNPWVKAVASLKRAISKIEEAGKAKRSAEAREIVEEVGKIRELLAKDTEDGPK